MSTLQTSAAALAAGLAASAAAAGADNPPAPPAANPPSATASEDAINAAVAKSLAAERTRIASLDAIAPVAAAAGLSEIVDKAKADGTSAGDAALALLAGMKTKGTLDMAAALASRAATVPPLPADVSATGDRAAGGADAAAGNASADAAADPEQAWKKEYAASAELRAEFGSENAFLAFKRAEAGGRVRVFGGAK
jgi:hypothetical protein